MAGTPPIESPAGHHKKNGVRHLGDFTASIRILPISLLAFAIGAMASVVAAALLKLIALFTNIFFYQRFDMSNVSPAGHHLGLFVIIVPIIGALIVGVMARYGSEKIRGHGIPEAIEAILMNGSRVEPKVALLKPLSAAISIGSGGPFGAEGPIIVTGGALGSLLAQFFHLTSAERKTLLVAGGAAGMSATFATPVAAVLLAVELLLFEWKPRSVIPVAVASVVAAAGRPFLIGPGPVFPVPPHAPATVHSLLWCVVVGLLAGVLAMAVTNAVYTCENFFERLPIHWMWWPALGGLTIGVGGYLFPQALGVGYDIIGNFLQGVEPLYIVAGVLIVKSMIWAVSLGSGTSGGVLAPLLMMGAALGGLEAHWLPDQGAGFWPLISMGAMLGGTMRVPLTAVLFAIELTHDMSVLLPLLVAVMVAYTVTVLLMRRSILTEKISRRGYHLTSEYSIDPLEIVFAREVMRSAIVALPVDAPFTDAEAALAKVGGRNQQRLFPIVDAERRLVGAVTRSELQTWLRERQSPDEDVTKALKRPPVVAYEDEPLSSVVYRMAETSLTRLPVVRREDRRLVGMVALTDMLTARAHTLESERRRERVLGTRLRLKAW
jgi:H+/Cl- antiporter ClcA